MRIGGWLAAGLAGVVILELGASLRSEDAATGTKARKAVGQVESVKGNPPGQKAKPIKKKLSGAELYSIHCNRCHPERYPTERTAAQWKTIMLHMRVRANLPAEHARRILRYLQENSGR